MQYDILKSGIDNVLALLNADNAQELTLEQIAIALPGVYEDELSVNPRNTQIIVSALPGSGITGSQTLRYTRLDLADKALEAIELQLTVESTLEEIRVAVAAQIGVALTEVKFDVEDLPVVDAEPVVINLEAVADSYGYIGTLAVTLKPIVVETDQELSELLTVVDLDGFSA